MDDRLQRRLRDADPLTAADGATPDPARLDAIKEQIMQSDARPGRAVLRPRAIGLVGVAAVSLAVVLVAGSLLRPAATTLAWDPSPTAATSAQKAAADAACNAGLPPSGAGTQTGSGPVGVTSVTTGAGTVQGGTSVQSGQAGLSTGGDGPSIPPMPTHLPPLVSLELHGTGGVAIFADAKVTAYCLLVKQGDGFAMGGLLMPDVNGASFGVGSISGMDGAGSAVSQGAGAVAGTAGDFQVNAMTMTYNGSQLGIIAGVAKDGAATVKVVGGAADGATASVVDGRFALWAPSVLGGQAVTVLGLDAGGKEVARQVLFAPGEVPAGGVTATAAP